MVGNRRHMGAYRRNRIKEGSPILDTYPVQCVRIVAAPDLGSVIHHACIKPAASAAAAFYQNIGVLLYQFFQKIIHPKNIIISYFSLILFKGINICEASVDIPLNVLYFSLIQHAADLVKHIVPYLCPGKIKGKLVPGTHRLSSRYLNDPVRVLPVKGAVLGNHLRLHPDAKF